MNYVYHWVPKNMKGDILKPLNILKKEEPDLYNEYIKKYQGREMIMNQHIPTLDCLWNDVLHFSPIHPQDIKDELVNAGMPADVSMICYKIPAEILSTEKTTIYFSGNISKKRMALGNFTEYLPSELGQYSKVPKKTIEYYKKSYGNNQHPLVFHGVPHILYKGNICISKLDVVIV